ncbi:hypothetical protein V6N13_098534 [Hibiscus sabdariffa]|uniref:Uncharacterized protein n=1 Tax=Hibiscus sabdariffa TaxID=183260 RepID=A0ABR2EE49_9ROSI
MLCRPQVTVLSFRDRDSSLEKNVAGDQTQAGLTAWHHGSASLQVYKEGEARRFKVIPVSFPFVAIYRAIATLLIGAAQVLQHQQLSSAPPKPCPST